MLAALCRSLLHMEWLLVRTVLALTSSTSGLDITAAIGGLVVSPSRIAAKATPVAADIIIIGDSTDTNKDSRMQL